MIKNIMGAIRSLSQKGRHNYMKIFSLAIGFAVGLILIAKVCFEQSYDNFYPDNDRIYQIHEKYAHSDEEDMNGTCVCARRYCCPVTGNHAGD